MLTAGAFAGGAALAVPFVAPELLRRRILSAITERTGLGAELDGVSLGIGSAELFGLRLSGHTRSGAAVEASFDAIALSIDTLELASGSLSGIDGVVVHGGALELIASTRADGAETGSAGGTTTRTRLPPIELEGVALSLGDEEGTLVRVERLSGHYAESGAHAEATGILVEGGPTWTIASASVTLTRPDGRLLLGEVAIRDAALAVRGNEADRRARLRALARSVRGGGDPEAAASTDSLDRLDAGFRAELTNVAISVEVLAEDEPDRAHDDVGLHELTASITRSGDVLATEGHARPGERGRLLWDLELEPRALLASGTMDLEGVSVAVLAPLLPALPFHAPEIAEVSGTLSLERAGIDEVRGSGSLDVLSLGFSHPRLSATPITNVAFGLRGTASWAPASRTMTLEEVFVRAPSSTGAPSEVRLEGTVVWQPERYAFDLHARLPSTPCNDAVHAIPADLLGELGEVALDGRIGGSLDVHVDSADLDRTTLRVRVADACRFLSVPPFADPARFAQPFHHRAVENDGDVFEMDTGPGTMAWTSISHVSPFLLHAVVAHEDASFFTHSGFAPWAIRDALVANLRAGRYVRGASTITMQLVKNAFLHREKTLARKVQEVLLTWWVETAMTKEQILELYLNVIELGDGVYGIRNAARSWFGREPSELSAAESVYLAMILPNPPAFSAEHRHEGRPPEPFRRRMANFLRHLGERGRYDAAAVEAGLADIEAMRFHRSDEPPPAARALVGSTALLPIGAYEALLAGGLGGGGIGSVEGTDDEPPEDEDEAGWERWEEVVP